jgi:stage V sporulation protein B
MQTLNGVLQGIGKPMVPVIGLLIGIVFKVVLTYTLTAIPSINIYGAAIGTVVAYLIAVVFELWYIRKHVGVKLSTKDLFIKPISMVIIMGIVVKLSYSILVGIIGGSLSTLVSIGVGGIIYVVEVFALGGITKEEVIKLPKGEKLYRLLNKVKLMK